MAERYQVTLHSQMGPRTGLLTLERRDNYFTGLLELMGYENTVREYRRRTGISICSTRSARRCTPCSVRRCWPFKMGI